MYRSRLRGHGSVAGVNIELYGRLAMVWASLLGAFAVPATATAQQFTEVRASRFNFGDIEFDWARDGINCPSCNFGQGNARFNWTDNTGNVWLGHVDSQSGAFTPENGKAELVDTTAANYKIYGNGPEWAFSQQGSQLVYTRYVPGMPFTAANAGAAYATMIDGIWTPAFFNGGLGSIVPIATQALADPLALASFATIATPTQISFEYVSASGAPGPVSVKCDNDAIRWVPGTHQLLCVGYPMPRPKGPIHTQILWLDTDTNNTKALTTDSTNKLDGFMFRAPEFGDNYVFFTVENGLKIDVYEQSGTDGTGAPDFELINQIASPDPSQPYISSPEPFVHCSPDCQTYIFMSICAQNDRPGTRSTSVPNGLAVTNIDPAQPVLKQLTDDVNSPQRVRYDPEYFITANGPYLYYERYLLKTSTTAAKSEGEFYIDMQLGPPSGVCVGSSAEGGLLAGC